MLNAQQRDRVDAHSRAVDTIFVDPQNGDFRIKRGSPAGETGIIQIDMSEFGPQDSLHPSP